MLLLLALWMSATPAQAAEVDYSHCINYIQSQTKNPGHELNGYWNVRKDGRLDERYMGKKSSAMSKDMYIFKSEWSEIPNGVVEGKVALKDGRPEKSTFTYKKDGKVVSVSKVEFNVRNGVCYPRRYSDGGSETKDGQTVWDTALCRDLQDYIYKHREATKCECGNKKTNKALAAIIEQNGANLQMPGRVYGYDEKTRMTDEEAEYRFEPAFVALGYIRECKKIPGVKDAFNDERIWKGNRHQYDLDGDGKKEEVKDVR